MKSKLIIPFVLTLQLIGCDTNKNKIKDENGKAISTIIKNANQGDTTAQFSLGYKYYFGDEVRQDKDAAKYWLGKAAQAGHEKAQLTYKAFFKIIPEIESNDSLK